MTVPLSHPSDFTNDEWLELMIEGLELGREGVPSGPPEEVQRTFVGFSGAAAMRQCYPFFKIAIDQHRQALSHESVLDYGVGWGRLIRLFARHVPLDRLFGVDVDPEILRVCSATDVPGRLQLVEPGGVLPFRDGEIGLAYAYSVFSHLSAAAAGDALAELTRVVRRGGTLTFTTQGMRFLDLCCAVREKAGREPLAPAETSIDAFFDDPYSARESFRRGAHAYTGIGGGGVLTGDFYGWAAIPEAWLRSNLPGFVVANIVDDPGIDEQVIITLRRR
ncbi:MAG: class I SAM-dependent methyltransferase [Acidimicrobiales bacterium]